jgi:hypothetical protein
MASAFPALGWPRMLDRPNRRLTLLARETASRATALIPPGTALHVGIACAPDGEIDIRWWTPEGTVCAELRAGPERFAPAGSSEGELQRAGLALLEYLAGRWPEGAVPGALGVITDGEGLAFSTAPVASPRTIWSPDSHELIAILPFAGTFCTHPGNGTVH